MAEIQVSEKSGLNDQAKRLKVPALPNEVRQDDYTYGYKGFRIHGYLRLRITGLRRLLFPELVEGKIDRKFAAEDFTGYVKSQLLHYDIDFKSNMDQFQLKALLLTQVANGKCDVVPTRIKDIKVRLTDEFRAKRYRYNVELQSYEAQNHLRPKQVFENCATPSEEVMSNESMFLRKYFLDGDENPDRNKTSRVIQLPNCVDEERALRDRVESIPGLHVTKTCFGNGTKGLMIGWNRANVIREAIKIEEEHNGGRGYSASIRDWDRVMVKHDHQVSEQDSCYDAFGAKNTIGNYVMRCSDIDFAWPKLSRKLELRIIGCDHKNDGEIAVFDLGIIFGMMILRPTPTAVSRAVANDRWDKIFSDSYDESDSDDKNCNKTNARRAKIIGISVHPPKRRRIDDPPLRRRYFQWRGYNTMSGAIQFDPNNRNKGYLQFEDDRANKFDGKIFMDLVGGEVRFQGYRMAGYRPNSTLDWDALGSPI